MGQPADQAEVLAAGQVLIDRGVLPGQADDGPHLPGPSRDIEAEHGRPAGVGFQDGGEDPHGRCLTRSAARPMASDQGKPTTGQPGNRSTITQRGKKTRAGSCGGEDAHASIGSEMTP
jgi:hypothetical protein